MNPLIRNVAPNGQVCLPPEFRGKQIVMHQEAGCLTIEPLQWDTEIGLFLAETDAQEIAGETVYSAKHNAEGLGLDDFGKALQNAQ